LFCRRVVYGPQTHDESNGRDRVRPFGAPGRALNSPSAAIRGRRHGGLREGGWLAYGHWLMRVSHDALRASVRTRIVHVRSVIPTERAKRGNGGICGVRAQCFHPKIPRLATLARDDTEARHPHQKNKLGRALNSPSAAVRGRCHGGLREGGWLAYGHWLMRVSHDARRASVRTRLQRTSIRRVHGSQRLSSQPQRHQVTKEPTKKSLCVVLCVFVPSWLRLSAVEASYGSTFSRR
jgi:hypothetical protein